MQIMEFFRPNSTAPSSPVHYSASSSPNRYGDQYYISAPSSPSHLSQFYRDFNDDLLLSPSDQRKPGNLHHEMVEFAFDVSDDFGNHSVSADELFHAGVIKPMQIPPAASREHRSTASKGKDFLAGALSPRNKKDSSSFMRDRQNSRNKDKRSPEHDRGRERIPLISSSSRRSARSLSPVRVSQYPWEEEQHLHQHQHQHQHQSQQQQHSSSITKPTSSSISNNKSQLSNSASKGLRKWRIKDFFLFRSASEGRSDKKDPLRKYTAAFRRSEEVKGGSSSKNVVESPGSEGSVSKRKGRVSAHELHYTANRAVSEDLKKKTFLPYKQGILGRLAINPAVHGIGNGFGFSKK